MSECHGFLPGDAPQGEDILNCMRCGACLPTCPTFQITGKERSSPRGRIALMRAVEEKELPLTAPIFEAEMDFCVGCLACVSACPAGVKYAHLLEQSRDQLARLRMERWPWWKRKAVDLIFYLFEDLSWLRLGARALRLYQISGLRWLVQKTGVLRLFPTQLGEMEKLLPPIPARFSSQKVPPTTPPTSGQRLGMLTGCVMDFLFCEENMATVEVLELLNNTVVTPPRQGCCGALHAHAGRLEKARDLARHNIAAFEEADVELIVVNSAGCGNAMKHYGEWLHDDPEWAERARAFSARVKDLLEYVKVDQLPAATAGQAWAPLTYHDACHLAHGQGVKDQPRALLRQLSPDGFRELTNADRCCGSAGTYNILQFETALKLLDDKVENIVASGATTVGVANPGCLLQIRYGLERAGSKIEAVHPVILLRDRLRRGKP